jgi:hypothetical protein
MPVVGESLDLEILHLGTSCRTVRTVADPANDAQLVAILTGAVRRLGADAARIDEYEMIVRYAGERGSITTIVAPPAPHATLAAVS